MVWKYQFISAHTFRTWCVRPVTGSHKTILWVPLVLIRVNFVEAVFPFADSLTFIDRYIHSDLSHKISSCLYLLVVYYASINFLFQQCQLSLVTEALHYHSSSWLMFTNTRFVPWDTHRTKIKVELESIILLNLDGGVSKRKSRKHNEKVTTNQIVTVVQWPNMGALKPQGIVHLLDFFFNCDNQY